MRTLLSAASMKQKKRTILEIVVLTHGVGPIRQYCIGAMLLDLENQKKIIARLEEPLLAPLRKIARDMTLMSFIPAARLSVMASWSFPMPCLISDLALQPLE